MSSTVDIDIASDAIAPLAGESLWGVALLRGGLIPLHAEIVMRDFQLPVRRLGIQLERLA